jgi:hypothetical protein
MNFMNVYYFYTATPSKVPCILFHTESASIFIAIIDSHYNMSHFKTLFTVQPDNSCQEIKLSNYAAKQSLRMSATCITCMH